MHALLIQRLDVLCIQQHTFICSAAISAHSENAIMHIDGNPSVHGMPTHFLERAYTTSIPPFLARQELLPPPPSWSIFTELPCLSALICISPLTVDSIFKKISAHQPSAMVQSHSSAQENDSAAAELK